MEEIKDLKCRFLGFAYLLTLVPLTGFNTMGVIKYFDDWKFPYFRIINTQQPIGLYVRYEDIRLEEGVRIEDIDGKICSRMHKVFTKDWPKEIPRNNWVGDCKFRVAIYDFPYCKFVENFPADVFRRAILDLYAFFTDCQGGITNDNI